MNIFQPEYPVNTRNNNALFWFLQIIGWGLFTLLNLAGRQYFVHFHVSELINSLVLGSCLIITTSLLRKYYQSRLNSTHIVKTIGHMILASIVTACLTMMLFAVIIVPNQMAIFKSNDQLLFQQIMLSAPMIAFLVLAWSALYTMLKKQQQLKHSQQAQKHLSHSLKEAQLDVFLSQINPHFIFNAINNIRALILEDADKARDMLAHLSEVMRYTMQIDKEKLISFSEEIDIVEQYIALNSLQFEDKLTTEYNLAPETMSLLLPPMVLQLLVENAIKHGIGKLTAGGIIKITSELHQEHWLISVENSGELLAKNNPKQARSGVGLNNIKQRLALVYGKKSSFTLESSDIGVKAMMSLPR
ncbi:sensor histidine kinase [Litorilituus lipolyticus]|uniref:Signal transduction histidine kinase internal region domain-containing protein n=1 Tax=Litorilituus lipolyticus TaxID=2491017 RepID=A0A502KTK2_9GAMM|nr:histidine kinase [Litorilituus lipolyticus]TPH13381.1 hypothetical protein EPA86_14425 [Litorilituus lipolyticus]